MDFEPLVIGCPYCLEILGTIELPDTGFEIPDECRQCGADPRADAAVELSLDAWLALPKRGCSRCGAVVCDMATRCPSCRKRPHPRAPVPLPRRDHGQQLGTRLLAKVGTSLLLEGRDAVRLVELQGDALEVRGELEHEWGDKFALAADGRIARSGEHIELLSPDAEVVVLPELPGVDPAELAFLGRDLLVFPSLRSELEPLLPWRWDGTRWSALDRLAPGEGWADDRDIWHLDGHCVHDRGEDLLLWDGRVLRPAGTHGFDELAGPGLRFGRAFGAARLGAERLVLRLEHELWSVAGRVRKRLLPAHDTVHAVLGGPDGSVVVPLGRNEAGIAAVVLWPAGSQTDLAHAQLGTDAGGSTTIVPLGDWLLVVRGDDGVARLIAWAEIAGLPRI